jgi:hypothetical protein
MHPSLIVVGCLVAAVVASDYAPDYQRGYGGYGGYRAYPNTYRGGRYYYGGKYAGM